MPFVPPSCPPAWWPDFLLDDVLALWLVLSLEDVRTITDEYVMIQIFVNPHKFAQHKQVWLASACTHAAFHSLPASQLAFAVSCMYFVLRFVPGWGYLPALFFALKKGC